MLFTIFKIELATMKIKIFSIIILLLISINLTTKLYLSDKIVKKLNNNTLKEQIIRLPKIIDNPLTKLLKKRRSIRNLSTKKLSMNNLSTILWSAQGINSKRRFRTAPSAGGLYPLTIYVIINNVKDLKKGFYQYDVINHTIILIKENDYSKQVADAAYKQHWIKNAPAIIIISGDYKITEKKYGLRSKLYIAIEIGAVAENIYLQASQLNLATTLVGGINQKIIQKLLTIKELPYALMPIANKR